MLVSRRQFLLSTGAAALALTAGPLAALAQPAPWQSSVQAWLYPGGTCTAAAEYADGRTIDTNAASQTYPGYATAARDPNSGELRWAVGGISYVASDSESMNQKRARLESLGVTRVSVWHLGGNQWFSGRPEPA